jgi:HAE1 family hydrophobic/amphiphilic exporter-1
MNLTLAAIKRPVWVWMLVVAALVMGWRALGSLPVEQNPDVTFPNISIQTAYFGAGPDEIETQISKKIEDAVTAVNGIQSIESTSIEGMSIVMLQFELSVNQDTALADVKSKVDAIVGDLPRDAEKPVISKLNFAAQPILYLAAESDRLSPMELRDYLDDRVSDRLSRIKGVADITVAGGRNREIRVAVHKNRLLSYGLGINDVMNAVRGATLNVPGGRITEGRNEASVRVKGEFRTVDELRNLVIPVSNNQDPNGTPAIVQLRDIATIIDGPAERTDISRVNGRESVILTVQKTREGNTVDIDKAVRAELTKVSSESGVKFTATLESAKSVEESISDLNVALFIGIVLVIGIIYMFLHNFRGTLIVALAIPTCLFVAFAAVQALGFTLNIMTMLGLSLAVGILVDDAIVVLENTYRHLVAGEPPEQAAINGRLEIGLAALAITMVDLVVFLPVASMGGIIGQFFRPFALTVAAATFTSLFVSFTLTPMLASRWYRKGENLEDKHGFAKWFDERFHAFANGYRNLLDRALKRRWFVFIAGWAFLFGVFMMIGAGFAPNMGEALKGPIGMAQMAVIASLVIMGLSFVFRRGNWRIPLFGLGFGLTLILFGALGFQLAQRKQAPLFTFRFFGGGDENQVAINLTMPPSSSLDRTTQVVQRIEKVAMSLPETKYVTTTIGSQQGGFGVGNSGSQYAQMNVTLNDRRVLMDSIAFWKEHEGKFRERETDEIVSDLQRKIGRIPDAKIIVAASGAFGGAPIDVRLLSTNSEEVAPAAAKALKVIAQIPGIVSPELSSKPGKPELVIRPDRTRMADNDISVSDVGLAVRGLYEGDTTAKYREAGQEYDIRVNLSDDVRQNPRELASVPVKFRQGNPVFLGDVATIQEGVGPDKVERRDRQRQIAVTAQLLPGFVPGTVGQEIDKRLGATNLGKDVTFKQGGENEVQAREFPYMGQAFMLGLILVFLVLASLFNNLLYPLIIQLAQPQALVGALLALMVVNRAADVVAMIGVIMLIGLVGKNAILLVDYTNTLRERGRNRHDALVEAGPTRLRPIMMTTLAMVLSMIPVAMAIGRGSEFRAVLGVVIIGGLTLSTLLTLFVIPCSYTIFDDLSQSISRFFRRKDAGPAVQESTAAADS